MRKIKLFRRVRDILAGWGLVTLVFLIFVFATNINGISTFISAVALIKAESLYDLDNQKLVEGATAGVVSSLNDPYSQYLSPAKWNELKLQLKAEFGGIGVYIVQLNDGRLVTVAPIKGTPAEKAGIKNGDVIIKINGQSTLNMNQDDAVQRMRGEPGTQLELTVYRESDGQEHTFKLIREIINVPSVEDKVLDSQAGIAYIKLNQFHAHSAEEMAASLDKISENGSRGIILDLRDNGGGEFHAALRIADLFLDNKEVVSIQDGRGNQETERSLPGGNELPMVVLVNENTASASEILSGALQDNRRAALVGVKTYGKGLVQTIFPLRDGGALKLTTQKYFTPNGTDINEIGIVPDYQVDGTREADQDPQLDKAVEVLKAQLK